MKPFAPAREHLYNLAWRVLPRVRRILDRAGILKLRVGKLDANSFLYRLGYRLVPTLSRETWTILPTGQRLLVPKGHMAGRTYLTGSYEPELTQLVLRTVGEGQVVVDIGAHIGYYTLIASKLVGSSGRVYAFEPDPIYCGYLTQSIEANQCSNVEAVWKAVTNGVKGQAPFWPEPNGGAGSLYGRPETAPVVVGTISLDEFFGDLGWPRVDFVKVDVEGAEIEVAEGMEQVSRKNRPLRMVVEFSQLSLERVAAKTEGFFSALEDIGFNRFAMVEEGLRPLTLPRDLHWLQRQARFRPINLLCEHGP